MCSIYVYEIMELNELFIYENVFLCEHVYIAILIIYI